MHLCSLKDDTLKLAWYQEQILRMDSALLELGLSQPALRALVNLEVFSVEALRNLDTITLKQSHGIGPKAYRKLETLR